jgi:hypothetical protein
MRDSRHHPVIDAIGMNTKLKPVFPVGSYKSVNIQESSTGRQRSQDSRHGEEVEEEEEEEDEEEDEEFTHRGIPPKDLCFNFVIKYWTSVNHVLNPIIPWTIANGSSILSISSRHVMIALAQFS